ncbi:hypothetical protein GCM10023116_30290 [Kistimonas scapharcae]|uniref:Response regulator n=1 Tax=Kistimonas scapharcae TaxID=1036133 RepID=A0ABP8V4L4_9GAMM
MSNSEQFEQMMAALRKEYLENLSGAVVELQQLLGEESLATLSGETFKRVKTIAHNLAGTGSTYGFDALSETAQPLDRWMIRALENPDQPILPPDSLARLKAQVLDLIQVATQTLNASDGTDTGNTDVETEAEDASTDVATADDGKPLPFVLLVDDDPMFRKAIILSLHTEPYRFAEADSGKKALKVAADVNPALILLDISMPDMSGKEILTQLADIIDLKHCPVIMLSAQDDEETVIHCLSSGATDYLIKPCKKNELRDKIRETLNCQQYSILLADDDPMIIGLVKNRLSHEGYNILTADNGDDAWTQIKTRKPDLAILDCMMPGMDGFAVLQKMKADNQLAHIPVIMLSALNQEANVLKGLKLGSGDYICKPFNPEELLVRVQATLSQAGI